MGVAMNTHEKYSTVGHHHFDFSYRTAVGQYVYPDSGLMLVECSNGRWFIQQEFGDEYSQFPGIVKSRCSIRTSMMPPALPLCSSNRCIPARRMSG